MLTLCTRGKSEQLPHILEIVVLQYNSVSLSLIPQAVKGYTAEVMHLS